MIAIPAPQLPAGPATIEKPIEFLLSGLAFADGSPVGQQDASMVGLFVFKTSGEVWDEGAKGWKPAPDDTRLLAMAPLPAVAGAGGWKATLVAAGKKDAGGADAYAPGASCHVRALAKAMHGGAEQSGLSPPSADFTFSSATQNQRFTIAFDTPDTPPDQARVVRLQLKDGALVAAGYVEICAAGREVAIASCDGGGAPRATVLLQADGSIHLAPAAGQRVVIDGDAEVGKLFYMPQGGGAKVWL